MEDGDHGVIVVLIVVHVDYLEEVTKFSFSFRLLARFLQTIKESEWVSF